ncbi:MAG: AAA family ATPase, partial [Anaerolineae bacterium]|nr:AAA family ATPase [Anaerolineae bacterium]
GAPPGYVGYEDAGQLTEAVRRRPYSIVVFDEIEKAHPEAFNMLLQVMEEGMLTDARGRAVDFRNTMIVMTSNVGADMIKRGARLGFNTTLDVDKKADEDYGDMSKNVMDQVRRMFRPEFLNRVDATVIFRPLSQEEIKKIVDLELNKVRTRLVEHAIILDITEEARNWLATEGYDAEYGARPLRRLIQNTVEDELSEGILSGKFSVASTVTVTVDEESNKLLLVGEEGVEVEVAEPSV